MHKLEGMLVMGVTQNKGGWSYAQYLARDGRWVVIITGFSVFPEPSAVSAYAQNTGFQPCLKGLQAPRAISEEDVLEILGPLEALASTQEPPCKR